MLYMIASVVSVLLWEPLVLAGLGPGVDARCTPVPAGLAQDGLLASLTPEAPPEGEFAEDHAGKPLRVRKFTVEDRTVLLLSVSGDVTPYLRHVCVVTTTDMDSADTRRALAWSTRNVLDIIFFQMPAVPGARE
ncbi:hypothetical protein [Brevundimonas sp.]|uniref:hypothetical protein n=1 Tax=Brevundimonas sp. TaxID=1871086 RepID=UPI00263650A8|nr:hypothetical protein [Brevundimonas sp.]